MEQELNNYGEFETDVIHFRLKYKNQNIKGNEEYQKWYENAINYIESKNKDSSFLSFYLINFCENCCSHSIFTSDLFCDIICQNCKYKFCIGCGRVPLSNRDISACLKGFLKINFLRITHEGTDIISKEIILFVFHIIGSLFFTPLYIGYIFNMLGFLNHPRKSRLNDNGHINDFTENRRQLISIHIFSIFKGFLFFPYITLFFPIMCLILLPGIFFHTYYLRIFNFYFTIVIAGGEELNHREYII